MLANLLAMPVVSAWVMPMGILGVVAMPFGFDAECWRQMGYGIEWMDTIALWVASLPGVATAGELMRGLAATDAGGEVLDAYEAIRAAGVKVGDLPGFAAPRVEDIAAAIEEVRNLRPRDWKFDQEAHLQEAQDWVARIATALPHGPEATLRFPNWNTH